MKIEGDRLDGDECIPKLSEGGWMGSSHRDVT